MGRPTNSQATLPPESLADGACRRPGVDPELFFTIGNYGGRPSAAQQHQWNQARAVCASCPVDVVADCLRWAINSGDDHAVLGNTTPAERRAMRRGRAHPRPIRAEVRVCALDDCGESFTVDRRNPDQRYCGRTCSSRANARIRQQRIAEAAREQVAA
jgi:WhiB family redox-sensing transcriptional regulator